MTLPALWLQTLGGLFSGGAGGLSSGRPRAQDKVGGKQGLGEQKHTRRTEGMGGGNSWVANTKIDII